MSKWGLTISFGITEKVIGCGGGGGGIEKKKKFRRRKKGKKVWLRVWWRCVFLLGFVGGWNFQMGKKNFFLPF